MTLDGRDGAFEMSYTRTWTVPNTVPPALLIYCKDQLYITENAFDRKLTGLIKQAIYEFEKITGKSVLEQSIELRYEYFKGKNKLPFEPHIVVDPITDFTLSGITSVQYLEGGTGEPLTVTFTAGNANIPDNITALICLLVGYWFRNEDNVGMVPTVIYSQIKQLSVHGWI